MATDREELIFLRDHINTHLGAVQQPPPVTTTPPPVTTTPPPTSGSGAPGNVWPVTEAFRWGDTGQKMVISCDGVTTYAIPYNVPAGWSGQLQHELSEVVGFVQDVKIKIWESLAPGGPAIDGTTYEGAWINGTMPNPWSHPHPGDYYFNVLIKDKATPVGVMQKRYP
ncbi:MAG TPA: hypothetical protein VLH12_08820 [Usitatibacter sp.]|nr:hypothetical protein [Usitatibacter sp.]